MLKILIIRLSSLGDVVHTYPMIYDIKQNLPNCEIDWVVDESFYDLVKLNPLVNNIIPIALRKWKKNFAFFDFLSWVRQNKNTKKYDYIIDVQGLIKSSITSKCFSGKIHGYDKNSAREKLASYLYDYKYIVDNNNLAINKSRVLASKIFNYNIDIQKCNFGLNEITLKNTKNLPKNKYIVFFHATSKESKKYPINLWVNLAKYLIESYGYDIVLPFGSSVEYQDSLRIQELTGLKNVLIPNRMNYLQLAGLIQQAAFVFGVDTGLVHLANALNKKTIAIYTDTNPAKTGVFESNIAINIGGIGIIPKTQDLIDKFNNIIKI